MKIKSTKQEAEDEKRYKELRKEYLANKRKYNELQKQIDVLKKKQPAYWETEYEMSNLAHKYHIKDVVVLKTKEIAQISQHIGIKHYKVFVHCVVLKHQYGTMRKIHENDILCHIGNLDLKNMKIDWGRHLR